MIRAPPNTISIFKLVICTISFYSYIFENYFVTWSSPGCCEQYWAQLPITMSVVCISEKMKTITQLLLLADSNATFLYSVHIPFCESRWIELWSVQRAIQSEDQRCSTVSFLCCSKKVFIKQISMLPLCNCMIRCFDDGSCRRLEETLLRLITLQIHSSHQSSHFLFE